jgi:ATP-dependent DNA helicase DinG
MSLPDANHFLSESGHLSHRMPGFEFRPQQVEMVRAVESSLTDGHHLIVEAGTGTGKSLAYLIPAILWAVKHNKKVVISTYSKTLQQQILNHDIPLLQEQLGVSFRYSLCLGHENYLSLRRMQRAGQTGLFTNPEEDGQMGAIFDWAGTTPTGLRNDLPFQVLPSRFRFCPLSGKRREDRKTSVWASIAKLMTRVFILRRAKNGLGRIS